MAISFFKPKLARDWPLSQEMKDAALAARERLEQKGMLQEVLAADRRAHELAADPQFIIEVHNKAVDAA
ncbi:MAG TPA: hypothetical protein VIJ59_07160 [Caulobacteraceae bacterium]